MKRFFAVMIVFAMAIALVSCGAQENSPEVKTDPNWKDSGKPPISILDAKIVTSLSSTRMVELTMENITNVPVSMVDWTIVLYNDNGKVLEDFESSYEFDVSMMLKPGKTETSQAIISNELASKAKVVIKSVTYQEMNPVDEKYGMLPYVWENSNFDKELEEAKK
jgi:uncharacterized protein YcfL